MLNVRGLVHKDVELQQELKLMSVDTGIIPETKKKLKGSVELEDYILLYSGVAAGRRAAAGVAVLIGKALKNRKHSYQSEKHRKYVLSTYIAFADFGKALIE